MGASSPDVGRKFSDTMAWPWVIRKDAGQPGVDTRAATGRQGEDLALRYLEARGLRLLERNYRVARGPSRRGGEIDLILRDRDGTLVFVEVRSRRRGSAGGAAASVGSAKRANLVYAAQTYLSQLPRIPPCRFDVVAVDAERVQWLKAAFDEC
jgi:putative endonuclease